MADIGVKMGVTGIAQFKTAMQQGYQSVKTLDAALKKNEAQYKATGDAEAYMQQKTKLLEQQIKAQKGVCDEAEKALETMTKQGVDPASKAYQQMQQQLLNAQTALLNMQNDLNGVGASAKGAADGAQQMNTELKHIGKQVDFQGVLTGIGKITDGMEKAAKSVINFAGNLWDTMKDAASWADDNITLSQMYGISVEDLQRMQKTAEIIDTPVEAIIKARQKLSMGLSGGFSADQMEVLGALGLVQQGKYGAQVKSYQNAIDMLWDVGAALDAMGDSIDRDAYAQQLFGRSWMELQPMFKAGRQAYDDTMNSWDVVAEENVKNLGTLDDSMKTLEGEFQTLKLTVLSELAPAFNELAKGVTDVLKQVNEYLKSDEGKEKLKTLGDAVTQLFENITNIDTGEIIDKVSGALDSITSTLDWIDKNKDNIVGAIKAIGAAFIGLKVAEVAASLAQGALALKNLFGGGSTPTTGGMPTVLPTPSAGGGNPSGGGFLNGLENVMSKLALFSVAKDLSEKSGMGLYGILYKQSHPAEHTIEISEEEDQQLQERMARRRAELSGRPMNTSAYESANDLLTAMQSGETLVMPDNVTIVSTHTGTGGVHESIYDNPYALPGSSTPNAEMQASWDAIVASVNETAEGIKTSGNDAADAIEAFAGRVNSIVITGPKIHGLAGLLDTWAGVDGMHANGLPWVPYDNYLAYLHRGERVVPANQNKSYTANNYLNVQSMYMNNGNDVHALAEAMAVETARMQQGFGG